jgi:signal transduction histidine kinase
LVDLQRDAHRIRNIVEQLLSATRLSELPAEIGDEVDLVAMSHSKAADAMLIAIQHGQQIEFEGPSTPVIVKGNRLALESVISNLIDNALRAEPTGGSVLVRVGNDAVVEVIDHGEGVAPSDREKIFEPFWRGSEATPGTGLGLAIAKDLIEKHNGRIWVEATRGGGATFMLWLPQGK